MSEYPYFEVEMIRGEFYVKATDHQKIIEELKDLKGKIKELEVYKQRDETVKEMSSQLKKRDGKVVRYNNLVVYKNGNAITSLISCDHDIDPLTLTCRDCGHTERSIIAPGDL